MQLDALLRSFFFHCQECNQIHANILYCASVGQHIQQIEIHKDTYPQVNFVAQGQFSL